MKKLLSTLLLLLLSLLPVLAEEADPALHMPHDPAGTPVLFYQGNTVVEPGHAVVVRGEYLDQAWAASLTDGEKIAQVELIQQNRQSFKFIIPEDFQANRAYTLALAGEKPLTIVINEPKVQWLQGDEGAIATVGGWVRVQGECLSLKADAAHTLTLTAADGTVTTLEAETVYDAYSVGFAIPELPQGDYTAVYSNGYAQGDAGTLTIGVSPESTWLKKVYNVLDYKIDNTGLKDATAMLNVLAGHISNTGGGVLYFPAGRYLVTGTLSIPPRVVIRGDGPEFSQIFWTNQWRSTKKYEDGYTDAFAEDAPPAISAREGNIAIENIEFAAGHLGTFLNASKGNVRVENVWLNQNSYAGTEYGWHKNYFTSILENEHSNGYQLMAFNGANYKVINCKFLFSYSGQFVANNGHVDYLYVQDTTFEKAGMFRPNVRFDGVQYLIADGLDIDRCIVGAKGDNVYIARTSITNSMFGDNRESFTTDVGAGITNFQGTVGIGEDGVSFTFPEETRVSAIVSNAQALRILMKIIIMEGTGAGQWRYVTGYDGNTAIIDRPFDVAPDENSRIAMSAMYTNWYFVDMNVSNGGMVQFYTAQANTVIDGMQVSSASGIKLYGQQTYGRPGVSWYNSVVNCRFSRGNHYHTNGRMDYWHTNKASALKVSERLPGGSFIAAETTACGEGQPAYSLCCTIRGNTLTNNCLIYLFSGDEGAMVDAVVDSNFSHDTRCGIYIEGTLGRLLLNSNTTENVPTPIEYFDYDPAQYRPQFQ